MTISALQKPEGLCWQPTELVSMLLSRGARDVVSHWITDGRFLDDAHQPRSLSFSGSGHSEFDDLVRQVGLHLAAVIIYSELLRKGIVEQDNSGNLLLRRSTYIPGAGFANEQAFVVQERRVSGDVYRRRHDDII
jgi:hypothetical protein